MINFSNYFGLIVNGHKDIDFVDVPVDTDVKIFLDPELIESGEDEFSKWCAQAITSYFDVAFHYCRVKDLHGLRSFLLHSAEPNETHLGHSVSHSQGRGASEAILFTVFSGLVEQGLFERGIIQKPGDIYILAPNFSEDRMSDLLTNILRNQLSVYTVAQCEKHEIPLDGKRVGWCWEESTGNWMQRRWICPIAYGKPVLLVPKHFVSRSYRYGTEGYIRKFLLEYRQKYHLDNRTDLCHVRELKDGTQKLYPPTKEELRTVELAGIPRKKSAAMFAQRYPETMRAFEQMRQETLCNQNLTLSDRELDLLLYPDRSRSA